MNKIFDSRTIKIGLGLLGLALIFAAFNFSQISSSAQTNRNINSNQQLPPRQSPTPPVKPTATATPNVSPTPNPDDDPNAVIKVESDLVTLNVRVVDRNGRVVNDIKNNEFRVTEDNAPQKIEFVSREEVPINYGIVVDNSGSLRPQLEKVIDAGKIFVNENKPDDAAFIIRFISSDKIEILQDFTKSKSDLNDALDNMFPEGGQTAIIDAVMLGAEKASEYRKAERAADKSRRVLILITDGEDRDSYYKEEDLFRQLREADVQIYPIGFVNDLSKDQGFIKKSPRDKAVKLLERMAQETGGKAYFPQSNAELPEIARNISNEIRTQYLISYAPTNDKKDGSFRAVKVTVADDAKRAHRIAITKPGYTARKS